MYKCGVHEQNRIYSSLQAKWCSLHSSFFYVAIELKSVGAREGFYACQRTLVMLLPSLTLGLV